MPQSFILDPVFQQYCLQVQLLLEQNNSGGLTRDEIGRLLEGERTVSNRNTIASQKGRQGDGVTLFRQQKYS
jgi:hypothetical protein